ncbi:MAG: archaeosine biosynthesis radical SAM protein RaSEA, partial [Thermoplasmata archaeon]|nr:archaeosine biosynthesis radical SAM protein RaSEA [Thermoplasmata archaeon]
MRKSGRINWTEPAASWSEKEVFNGSVEDSLVIILRTKGCSWHRRGGCLMCGYHFDSDPSVKDDDVLTQLESALGRIKEEKIAKLYNSGSFFDEEEISGKLRKKILEALEGKVEKLVVETRPEFISDKPIKDALGHVKNLEVAVGLESANDLVLEKCVNKGFTFKDFEKGATTARDAGASVRTYLLVKPPFLTEKEAIEDAVSSAKKAAKYSDVISFNPLNIQKGTLVEKLWRRGDYRPPWLWSVLDVIEKARDAEPRIICGPS